MSSVEEIRGDLDRVKIILTKLNDEGLRDNTRLGEIRARYENITAKQIKSKTKKWTSKIYEDTNTTEIIIQNRISRNSFQLIRSQPGMMKSLLCFNFLIQPVAAIGGGNAGKCRKTTRQSPVHFSITLDSSGQLI